MKHILVMMLLAVTLVGCAADPASPWLVQRESSKPRSCEPLTSDQELVLGLSQEMASSGRLHAALANLERLPTDLPEARLRKAQLLRVLGRPEAQPLYSGLVNTCLVADAHHGLGQIAVADKSYTQALHHLRIATSLAPASDAMRNDLGVTYLNMQRLSEAHFELMTAMELNEADTRATQNMLTLLIYQDKWNHARDLVTKKKLTTDQFRDAEKRATALKAEHAALLAADRRSGRVPPSRPVEKIQPNKAKTIAPVPVQPAVVRKPVPAAVKPAARSAAPTSKKTPAIAPAPVRAVQPSTPAKVRPVSAPASSRPAAVKPSQPAAKAAPVGAVRGVQRAPSAGVRLIEPITGY